MFILKKKSFDKKFYFVYCFLNISVLEDVADFKTRYCRNGQFKDLNQATPQPSITSLNFTKWNLKNHLIWNGLSEYRLVPFVNLCCMIFENFNITLISWFSLLFLNMHTVTFPNLIFNLFREYLFFKWIETYFSLNKCISRKGLKQKDINARRYIDLKCEYHLLCTIYYYTS